MLAKSQLFLPRHEFTVTLGLQLRLSGLVLGWSALGPGPKEDQHLWWIFQAISLGDHHSGELYLASLCCGRQREHSVKGEHTPARGLGVAHSTRQSEAMHASSPGPSCAPTPQPVTAFRAASRLVRACASHLAAGNSSQARVGPFYPYIRCAPAGLHGEKLEDTREWCRVPGDGWELLQIHS